MIRTTSKDLVLFMLKNKHVLLWLALQQAFPLFIPVYKAIPVYIHGVGGRKDRIFVLSRSINQFESIILAFHLNIFVEDYAVN